MQRTVEASANKALILPTRRPASGFDALPGESPWLAWVRRLDAMARIGAAFAANPHGPAALCGTGLRSPGRCVAELHARPAVDLPELYAPSEGYVTPKADVRVAVFDAEGRILLVRETQNQRWSMPGGWADVGDSPARSAEREVREEAGYDVELTKLIGVFDAHNPQSSFSAYKIVFAGRVVGGSARSDHETDAVDFFAAEDLPPLCAFRTPRRVAAEAFEHWVDPDRPPRFE